MSEKKPERKGPGPGHGPGRVGMGEKPKNFKGTMKTMMAHLKPFIPSLVIVVIFAMLSSVFSIAAPKVLGSGVSKLYEGVMGTEGIDFGFIGRVVFILMGLYGVSAVFSFVQAFVVAGVGQKVSYGLRKDISEKINRLPLKYFDTVSHGEVMSRVTNDVDTVSQTLNQSLSQMITSITSLIGIIIMMLSISPIMTLVALLVIPASFIIISLVVKVSQKHFRTQQEYLGHVNGHIEEVFSGHIVMKAFCGEDKEIAEFKQYNDKLYQSGWKSQFLSGIMMPLMNFVGNIGYVVVCILGAYLAVIGRIRVGDITAFIQYVRSFNQPISQTAQVANILQSTAAAAERVFQFLDEEEEVPESTEDINTEAIVSKVDFKKVSFGYNPEKIIINDFTASINEGQRVAIVGPTGAGKTTIVKLLMRFYDTNKGSILVGGRDIKDFKRNDLRGMFGMVLQDTWLFNGTVMDNIRYGSLDAGDEDVVKAARAAHIHWFIRTLPGGYDMVLNEEASNISQGQKQLLTIARSFLADPKILILDEATSSVDTRTEVLVQQAMAELLKDRTSFIIAHRLSTIRDADLILVMNNGDIVEQGTHEELLEKKGFYYELYNSQYAVA